MDMFFLGIIMLAVMICIGFGWLIPLIIGLVKLQRKTGAKWWLIGSGVWASLDVVFIGLCVFSVLAIQRTTSSEAFNAETYSGALATVVLPYTGSGTLSIRRIDTGKALSVSFVNTNAVAVPTGTLKIWYLSYQHDDVEADGAGGMNCSFASDEEIVAQPNDVITLPGGAPLTASITVKKAATDKLQIDYALKDVAGNRISLWGGSSAKDKPGFEAIGPDGKSFWSAQLEYG